MSNDLITSETRSKIKEVQRQFFVSNLILRCEKEYLDKSFEVLFADICEYFQSNLILFDAFSLNNNHEIINIGESLYNKNSVYKFLIDQFNPLYHKTITELLKHSREDSSFVSISNELIQKNKESAVCLFGNAENKIEIQQIDCLNVNLSNVLLSSDINFSKPMTSADILELSEEVIVDDELNNFCSSFRISEDKNYGLRNTIVLYKSYLNRYDKIYAYFIRPRAVHGDYNGAMVIFLRRELSEAEFNLLCSILKEVLSELALAKSLENEWEAITNEQNHTSKHMLNAIGHQLKSMRDEDVICCPDLLKTRLDKICVYMDMINKSNDFLLNIMRAQGGKIDRHAPELDITGGDIKKMLSRVVDMLEETLFSFGFSDNTDQVRELRIQNYCMPILRESIQKLPRVGFQVIQIGLEIVLIEILKNAIFHADLDDPEVRIFLDSDDLKEGYYTLHFVNNRTASQSFFDFIRNGVNHGSIGKQYKSGIRTIKRILNFSDFNLSKVKWGYDITNQSTILGNCTNIYLLIPKTDTYD